MLGFYKWCDVSDFNELHPKLGDAAFLQDIKYGDAP